MSSPFQKSVFLLSALAFLLICTPFKSATAQDNQSNSKRNTERSFEDKIPDNIIKEEDAFFTFTIENDLFGGAGTDENYTNGARVTYFDVGKRPTKLARFLDTHVPFFNINKTTSTYYSFGQNLYTPEIISTRTPDPDDRPYAAFLYGSMGLITVDENHIDDMEVTIGVVGPWAFGEDVQRFVHNVIDVDEPLGWDTQLENEPGLILSWQRHWPEAFASEIGPLYFRTSPHVGLSAGNIYTYAATGATVQLMPKHFKWQTRPPRVRPAIPGSGFFAVPDKEFAWSVFAGTEVRAIARNIFLDGNTFEDSPSVDKKNFVTDLSAGVSTTYGKTQISYTLNWRSKEFDGQDDPSIFGAISIGYKF